MALRDYGRLEPGQSVLINGAAGGVGTFAGQTAKALGADVIGVCSTRNVDLVRSIGAAHVIAASTSCRSRPCRRTRPSTRTTRGTCAATSVISLGLQNLFDESHPESGGASNRSKYPRGPSQSELRRVLTLAGAVLAARLAGPARPTCTLRKLRILALNWRENAQSLR
jgi:NAD(P)-dependent dehydrogenase (short-subunit alcohol dehydrogenase family)